jgi:arylsulfatase A-like enzyme
MKKCFLFLVISGLFLLSCSLEKPQSELPNIIFILADDLGYGDVSTFNPDGKINTPNIDQLADEGIKFTDAHTSSAVCSPTRYGILTGRYNWRTRLKQGVLWSWDAPLIDKNRTTVGSMLKSKGYTTGAIGKWHLGLGWQKDENDIVDVTKTLTASPNDNGFDYFFGITASLDIPPYFYIENDRITTSNYDTIPKRDDMGFWREGAIGDDFQHEEVLPVLTKKAIEFITTEAKKPNPFFLYFPLPAPHTPILPTTEFQGKSQTNEYGDFVLMVDDVVGQVMKALKIQGISENTLIIFTSDNGCSPWADFDGLASLGHDPSGIYRGHKADIYEGGHRVPFVVRWPNKIKAGSQTNSTICTTDFLATCGEVVNYKFEDNEAEDSFSFLSLMDANSNDSFDRESIVHHSINGSFAIRKGDWKLIMDAGSGGWSFPTLAQVVEIDTLPTVQLYNLTTDPTESINLQETEPLKVAELTKLLTKLVEEGRSTTGATQTNDPTDKWTQIWWMD